MTFPTVSNSSTRFFWLIILSVFCSPLTVFIEFGCGQPFLINVLLWLFIPFGGFVHSTYMLSKRRYNPEHADYEAVGPVDDENRVIIVTEPVNSDNSTGGAPVVEEYHDEPSSTGSKSEHINPEHEHVESSTEEAEPEQATAVYTITTVERPTATEIPHDQTAVPVNSPPPYGPSSEHPVFDNKIQRN